MQSVCCFLVCGCPLYLEQCLAPQQMSVNGMHEGSDCLTCIPSTKFMALLNTALTEVKS